MIEYPDAKVILTVRDPDRWYESARGTIFNIQRVASSPIFSLAALFVPRMRQMRRVAAMASDLAWNRMFHGRFEDRAYAIKAFERWNEEVIRSVPSDKLLVYEVKEGWGPLCEFLGVEAPEDQAFPHLNDGEAFRKMIRRRTALASAVVAGIASLALLPPLYLALRRRGRA